MNLPPIALARKAASYPSRRCDGAGKPCSFGGLDASRRALELAPIGEQRTIDGRYEGGAIVGRVASRWIALPYRRDLQVISCASSDVYTLPKSRRLRSA